jgi:hypothetical protein
MHSMQRDDSYSTYRAGELYVNPDMQYETNCLRSRQSIVCQQGADITVVA